MIIKRVGGKSKIADWIRSSVPPCRVFVDVFGGSGAVLSEVKRNTISFNDRRNTRYVFNDLDKKIFTFFSVLKHEEHHRELARQVYLTPYSREEFNRACDLIGNEEAFENLDIVDKAITFLIVNRQSFGSKMDNIWSITRNGELNYETWGNLSKLIKQTFKTFRRVYLENLDYKDLIKKWDGNDTCFYLDPPYLGVEKKYYDVNRKDGFNHSEMFDTLYNIKGMYLVSYYGGDTEQSDPKNVQWYRDAGCRIKRKTVVKHLSNKQSKNSVTEVLICSSNAKED